MTTELALAWARLPGEDAHPAYLGKRLCVVRGFARHLQAFDPATEVPPAGLLPGTQVPGRPLPVFRGRHRRLDAAAGSLRPALRAATFQTLIGLCSRAGCGSARPSGWTGTTSTGDEGLLVIGHSKFGKSREVPLHPSTPGCAAPTTPGCATAVPPARDGELFGVSRRDRGWSTTPSSGRSPAWPATPGFGALAERCRPRLHDLRHAFACAGRARLVSR